MGDAAAGVSEYLYMLSDALGSVVALADDDGEIVERYHYSPYGVTPLLQPNVNSNGLVIG